MGRGIWIIMVHNLVVCISGRFSFFFFWWYRWEEGVACGDVGLINTYMEGEPGGNRGGWFRLPEAAGQGAAFVSGIPSGIWAPVSWGRMEKKRAERKAAKHARGRKRSSTVGGTYLGGQKRWVSFPASCGTKQGGRRAKRG